MHSTRSLISVIGRPIHLMLVPIPIICFIGAFLTDIAYANSYFMQWANMSVWLLTIGLFVSIPVVLSGIADFAADPRARSLAATWVYGLSGGLALLTSIFNAFVHSRDAYTSVVPTGETLSGVVVLILMVTSLSGWTMVRSYRAVLQ